MWCLLIAFTLLSYVTLGHPVQASPAADEGRFSGFSEIEGPLNLQIAVTPPVARLRDTITINITLTNQLEVTVAPTVDIKLPGAFSPSLARYPAATTFDYQHNALSWQPVVGGAGDTEHISLEYTVAVIDIGQPEQTIDVHLEYGETNASTSVAFWVGSEPAAKIVAEQQVVAVGQPVRLQAQASGPGPFTQTWDLGDGRQITARDPEVSFALPGIYEVRLHVANPLAVATAISAVTVVPQPTAAFSVDDEMPVVGQSVTFVNESGGERPLNSHWYFGDGAESGEASPTHSYTAPGTYIVRLVMASAHGQSEISVPISVGANPVADMVLPDLARTGEAIEVRGFGDDSVDSLRWDMGDGRELEGDVVSHTFHRAGEFTVTLIASNEYGETRVSRQIHVEGGLYALYLPLMVQPALDGGSTTPIQETADAAVIEVVTAPAPSGEPGSAESVAIPAQSGSTAPNPGGAAAELPQGMAAPVALPPQTPLSDSASVAEQLLWYVNEARRLHGLGPLHYNYELSIAAQIHTVDMAQNPDVMHVGSDGSRPAERQQRFGYLGAYGGEAVAWGWESPVPVVEFWVNSPPHRTLILNPDADEVGVGFTADGHAPNIWYWAVEFGVLP